MDASWLRAEYWQSLIDEAQHWSSALTRAQMTLMTLSAPKPGLARDCVYHMGSVALYHYKPIPLSRPDSARPKTPLLIVFSLINSPDILDLTPRSSFIRKLLETGRDVWLLDWGDPTQAQAEWDMSTYVTEVLPSIFKQWSQSVDVLSICQGGTLMLMYTAWAPQSIRKLIVMNSTIDFHTPDNLITHWVSRFNTEPLLSQKLLVPHSVLAHTFQMMRPFKTAHDKFKFFIKQADDPEHLLLYKGVEHWLQAGPKQVGRALAQYLKWFYQNNGLLSDSVELAGTRLSFTHITQPVMGIYATRDHVVPLAGARALSTLLKHRPIDTLEVPTGHIGSYVSPQAQSMAVAIDAFLA
jgi:polyhydroxyalkanoate synthase